MLQITSCYVLWLLHAAHGLNNRVLKQTWRRRQRERHLKMQLRVSAILSQLFKVIRLAKCVLTIPELNWDQRFRNKTKLNIFHHILTSSTQLQNRSFHGVERTRTTVCEMSISEKCTYKTCKACKTIVLVAVVVVVA